MDEGLRGFLLIFEIRGACGIMNERPTCSAKKKKKDKMADHLYRERCMMGKIGFVVFFTVGLYKELAKSLECCAFVHFLWKETVEQVVSSFFWRVL